MLVNPKKRISYQRKIRRPYLPTNQSGKKFTLVLDLDETLIHYDEKFEIMGIRPAAESFLRLLSKFYEIVIFTAATDEYTNWAFSFFQKEAVQAISYKLCR